MTSALRWAAMRAVLMFHTCEGQSHKTVSMHRPQVVSLAGLVSYANTEVPGWWAGEVGEGGLKMESRFGALAAIYACIGDPLLLSSPSLCFVRWCEDFRQLYFQYRSAAWGSFVNDFQFPSVSDFHNLLLLQQGLHRAFFTPRVFHLLTLLHGLEPFHVGWCEVFDYTSSAPLL